MQLGANSEVSGREFEGTLDEVRISEIARSADYIEAEYLSMTDAFITYGPEESNDDSYYEIIVPMPDEYADGEHILDEKWKDKNTEYRWELKWRLDRHEEARFDPIFLLPNEVLTMTFKANVTLDASGAYLNEFIVDCIRYPLIVEKYIDDPPGQFWPEHPSKVDIKVTMENVDVEEVGIDKIKAWLPGPDTEDEADAMSYKDNSVSGFITHTDSTTTDVIIPEPEEKQNKWDGKKDRWKVEFDNENVTLQPGEIFTVEFDGWVNPTGPEITYSELLWEARLKDQKDNHRRIYSFPTAGVVVPQYDVKAETLSSILYANAKYGGGKVKVKSVHWKKHK
ncbi:hypothetical protein ES703_81775 [subsurface metagenome]